MFGYCSLLQPVQDADMEAAVMDIFQSDLSLSFYCLRERFHILNSYHSNDGKFRLNT